MSNLLFTSSLDLTIRLSDISSGSEVSCFDIGLTEGGAVSNLCFNYDGSLVAAACKDRTIRVLDPRSGLLALTAGSDASIFGRNLRVEWCTNGPSQVGKHILIIYIVLLMNTLGVFLYGFRRIFWYEAAFSLGYKTDDHRHMHSIG